VLPLKVLGLIIQLFLLRKDAQSLLEDTQRLKGFKLKIFAPLCFFSL
jgi:hypothetical protein